MQARLPALLAGAATIALGIVPALAQAPAPAGDAKPTELDAITVTATRMEQSLRDVPATVTVIDDQEIDARNVNNIRDLVRYEPGVSVGNSPQRTGRGSYVIRGVGENRVLLTIDGVRVPDAPANSQPGTFMRDYIDLESIKRVEIVRGPASPLYGSDAIGGVVAYFTKDPQDYLSLVSKDWYVSGKLGVDTADTSFTETGTVAARAGNFEALAMYTRRDGQEMDAKGATENPQNYWVNNFLGKLVWRPSDEDRIRFTIDATERRVKTDIRSEVVPPTVLKSQSTDDTLRTRFGFDGSHIVNGGFIDRVSWRIAYQSVDRDERVNQLRFSGGAQRLRATDQSFEQSIISGGVQLESSANWFGVPHRIVYGFDADYSDTKRPRDRTETNLVTGVSTKTVAGETFPSKPFPDSNTFLGGLYAQDEIAFLGGRLSIIPGVRVDYYRMEPHLDQAFLVNNPNPSSQFSTVSASEVSPKLGAVFRLDQTYSVYAQYAHGFRSPPYDDANIGFTNSAFGYTIIPNPDLKPETSDGVEIGVRGAFRDGSSFQISGFYTLYKNFIEQRTVGTTPSGLIVFQAVNLERVKIYGAEAKGRWQITDEIALQGAVAYARGEDEETGLPVDSVDPLKGVLGLRYESRDGWGGEVIGTAVAKKERVSDPSYFKAPSYQTVDVLGFFNFNHNLTVNVGVFNLFNEKYWVAQDVVGVAANSAQLPLYASPGRTVAANVTLRW